MATAVNEQSAAVIAMASAQPMLQALMAGTAAMRAVGEKLLPRWPNEQEDSYRARRDTATLFPAFRRTVSVMAGKPFSKALTYSDDTPAEIQGAKAKDGKVTTPGWADDIDREGVSLHTFAAEMLTEALAFGFCGILVDSPPPIAGATGVPTKAEQDKAGIRPYFVRVMHNQVLGWRVQRINGARTLVQLRIMECTTEPDGEFGEKTVERVRVLTPGAWALWEKQKTTTGEDDWVTVEEGVTSLTYIPFVPIYGRRTGFMAGVCPLIDLAYLNVKHWQSQSDQDTILHVARVPILAMICGDDAPTLTVGAASAVKIPIGGDLKFVEHTGAAIEAGANSLNDLEDQMIQAGAELLVKKPGDRSATEAANDAEANKSDLQRIVEGFEDSLDAGLQMLADFASLPTGGKVSLFKDFGAANLSEASGQLVLSMEQGGLISKDTAIEEMKRRGELSAEVNAEDEAEKIDLQGPALGTITDPVQGLPTQPGTVDA